MDNQNSLEAVNEKLSGLSFESLFKELSHFTEELGFSNYLYTAVPEYFKGNNNQSAPILTTSYDPDWMQYYVDERFDQFDVALKYCLEGKHSAPFIWREHFKSYKGKELLLYNKASEIGIKVGTTIPILNSIGSLSLVSLVHPGEEKDFNKTFLESQRFITQFIYMFNEKILTQHSDHFAAPYNPLLTQKELDILKYLSAGYTRQIIAEKKTRAIGTIDKQINSIINKLHAKNIVHAVSLALKWKII